MPKSKLRSLNCTLCTNVSRNRTDLLSHIKNAHAESDLDEYQCPLCNSSFDQLWKLGRHLSSSCFEHNTANESSNNIFFRTKIEYIEKYRKLTREAAFDLTLKLAKNINVPRNSVFEVINDVKLFLTLIGEGLKDVAIPLLKENKVHDFESLISVVINDSFKKVDTEHKLDKCLSKKNLISEVKKVNLDEPLISFIDESEGEVELEQVELSTDRDEHCNIDGKNDGEADNDIKKSNPRTAALMDVHFQIKKFFEMPNVFNKIMSNSKRIKNENKLNHYINGKSWKSKLKFFSKNDIVIPYHLHIDDTQTNNSLGSHTINGDQTCVYYTFPTIPNEYVARLHTIFTALLFKSSYSKTLGNKKCYDALVDELNKLADYGIALNIDGEEQKVFFVLGLLLGDNKGLNDCLGFSKGFSANYYCRFCRLHREQMQFCYKENINSLRNRQNYEEDLEIGDMALTGIHEDSPFNQIRYFHATDSCADVMHDVDEGILHYNTCEILLHCIKKKYFTLSQLNAEKCRRRYGEMEENNRSGKIKMKYLRHRKLKMTASETHSFVHHLPFNLLNIVKENRGEMLKDDVWQFLLITIRFLDMCYMTEYDDSSIDTLRDVVANMNKLYVQLFNVTLKPKHHFAVHYPTLIKKFGPLRYMSSMRFEAKHKHIKNYTKNTVSRRNLSYSIGRKLQYDFAYFLKMSNALQDKFEMFKAKLTRLIDEDFFPFITPSSELDSLSLKNLTVCEKVKVNGLILSSKLHLPHLNGKQMQLLKIVKILIMSASDHTSIKVLYQKYDKVIYFRDYASYTAQDLLPEMHLLDISDVQRMFPVVLHQVDNINMFRYKTF